MMRYFTTLLSIYIDVRDKKIGGGLEGCEWQRVWKIFRKDVINAGKTLARARWELLKGTGWKGGVHAWRPWRYAKYSYKDGVTGK